MNSIEPQPTGTLASSAAAGAFAPPAVGGRKLGRLAWGALVLVIVAALAGLIPRWRQRTALRIETRELAIPTITVVSPSIGKTSAGLSLSAEVRALVEAPIYARASGYLKDWLVDLGAQVKAGQLLAEIDTPEVNQELARSQAELAQAQAALALARTTAARWTGLLKTTSVSEQEVAEKDADLALKLATVEAAQANVRRLEELQSFGRVTAPFSGTITSRRTDVGELIAASGGKELFRLAQTEKLRVYVRLPQSAAQGLTIGHTAELRVPELPGRVFPAKIVRTAGVMSADSRTLLTELEVENPRGEILAGSYVEVRFTDLRQEAPLTLPSNTLLFRAEGPQVGVVKTEGGADKVELRTVTIGRDFGATLEVLDGVGREDRVVLNPPDSLVSGAIVRVAQVPAR